MSLFDRMSDEVLDKLNSLKKEISPSEEYREKNVLSDKEEEELKEEILKQIEIEEQENEAEFLDFMTGPSSLNENKGVVEVEYYGNLGYVDISFESLDENITESEYQTILQAIENIAYQTNGELWKESVRIIESFGERSIIILFRECRKFDLSDDKIKSLIIQLLNRLTNRSLKGRRIIKAILEKATIRQHINFAILVAGSIRDQESVSGLLKRMSDPEYFKGSLDALLNIAKKESIPDIFNEINNLDLRRTDLIEHAIKNAYRFSEFGTSAVKVIFELYIKNEKYPLGPIYTTALRSFQEDAIPMLKKVLNETDDDNLLIPICQTLGSLRMTHSTNVLVQALEEFPDKKRAIIRGLSYTRSEGVLSYVLSELKTSNDLKVKQECLLTIGFIGNRNQNVQEQIKPYLNNKNSMLYLEALNCMVSLGNEESFLKYVSLLVEGSEFEKRTLQRHVAKLQPYQHKKLAESLLTLSDEKSLFIICGLLQANVLNSDIGPIIIKRLDYAKLPALRIEIYKLIGKHVNKKKELLPQEVLYDAKRTESDVRVVREIDHIISSMKKEQGRITINRETRE
ncbi:hypothetical protein H70357_31165 [Paenibacillus sp. FSL H7-0357]|uniref:HEAT repeat domain-containing protein n=1 Tax=Paenibacillus sp. FSL H7-0357 TaxID=1536774 RepID=UPI0004F682A6|nr:HEAT repeat domain-containing protein [Paenibacillus sp. FSL H7-0357]AIQ20653.1 hypothetical protein H70357_31165 [Paenibacillus sp. FSL H7-0357]